MHSFKTRRFRHGAFVSKVILFVHKEENNESGYDQYHANVVATTNRCKNYLCIGLLVPVVRLKLPIEIASVELGSGHLGSCSLCNVVSSSAPCDLPRRWKLYGGIVAQLALSPNSLGLHFPLTNKDFEEIVVVSFIALLQKNRYIADLGKKESRTV